MTADDGQGGRGRLRVGCSGYDYPEWRGRLYPDDLPRGEWFGYYAERFGAVEINNTFYSLPDAGTVRRWREEAPGGFRYAVKLSRYGSHMKRLKDPGDWLEKFTDAVAPLGDRLGVVLVQLPPKWGRDLERLEGFLEAAPGEMRWAVEFRDPDWLGEETFGLLRRYGAALVVHDLIRDHPRARTAGVAYWRFHGPDPSNPYHGRYPHQRLVAEAGRLAGERDAGGEVYAFFNNDVGGAAPADAERLARYARGR